LVDTDRGEKKIIGSLDKGSVKRSWVSSVRCIIVRKRGSWCRLEPRGDPSRGRIHIAHPPKVKKDKNVVFGSGKGEVKRVF